MARRSLTGQLNMFDYFRNIDANASGEVEMVSLMPWEEEPEVEAEVEPEVELEIVPEVVPEATAEMVPEPTSEVVAETVSEIDPEPEPIKRMKTPRASKKLKLVESSSLPETPVMSRNYMIDGREIAIAYINYNKVRITETGKEPEVFEFTSSKEAVDYYVQRMQELEPEE